MSYSQRNNLRFVVSGFESFFVVGFSIVLVSFFFVGKHSSIYAERCSHMISLDSVLFLLKSVRVSLIPSVCFIASFFLMQEIGRYETLECV